MHARLPFTFIAPTVMNQESDRALPTLLLSAFEVEIPEVDERRAEEVAVWTPLYPGEPAAGGRAACRLLDGQFYIQASEMGDVPVDREAITRRFVAGDQRGVAELAAVLRIGARGFGDAWPRLAMERMIAILGHIGGNLDGYALLNTITHQKYARHPELGENTREHDLAAARRQARSLVVMGDRLWRRVHEPKISNTWSFGETHWTLDFGDGIRNERSGELVSPVNALMAKLEDYPAIRDGILEAPDVMVHFRDVTILKPEAFSFDPQLNLAHRTLLRAVDVIDPLVGSLDAVAVDIYLGLREQVTQIGTDPAVSSIWAAYRNGFLPVLSRAAGLDVAELECCASMVASFDGAIAATERSVSP